MRRTDCSSDIGLASRTTRWRGSSAGICRRSTSDGAAKLQPSISYRPAPTSASSARRRSRWCGSSRPLTPRREGSVSGSRSKPQIRPTSSTRSASRVTSSRRQYGTVTSRPSSASAVSKLSRARISACSARGIGAPRSPSTRASRSRIVAAAGPGPPTSIVPPTGRAPHSSTISFDASACPSMPCSGWICFSKRPEASVRRPRRVEVRWMLGPFQVAASISTRVVPSLTSERAPPMIPAMLVGPSASSITQTSGSSVRSTSSSVVIFSPSLGAPHDQPPAGDQVGVEGVHRLAGAAASRSW